MTRRHIAILLVATMVLFAGCNSFTPDPNQQDPDSNAIELDGFDAPDGVTEDGIDMQTLGDTHTETLLNSDGFTLTYTSEQTSAQTTTSANITQYIDGVDNETLSTTTQAQEQQGQSMEQTTDEYSNETQTFMRTTLGNETQSDIQEIGYEQMATDATNVAAQNTGENTSIDYTPVELTTIDGTDVAVFEGTTPPSSFADSIDGEITEFSATISVTESGIIKSFTYDATVETSSGTISESIDLEYTDIGDTSVEKPDWTEDVSASDGSEDGDETDDSSDGDDSNSSDDTSSDDETDDGSNSDDPSSGDSNSDTSTDDGSTDDNTTSTDE